MYIYKYIYDHISSTYNISSKDILRPLQTEANLSDISEDRTVQGSGSAACTQRLEFDPLDMIEKTMKRCKAFLT